MLRTARTGILALQPRNHPRVRPELKEQPRGALLTPTAPHLELGRILLRSLEQKPMYAIFSLYVL